MKVSIIVCTYNREKYIKQCLIALHHQEEKWNNYEVLIIDNNSTDATHQISQQYIEDNSLSNFRLIKEANQGLTYARNKGILEAKYDIISFVDDDATVRHDFISNLIKNFETHLDILAIGGKVIPVFPESDEPKWISKYIEGIVSRVDYGNETKYFKEKFPVGCNMSFRKEIFESLGRFNTNIKIRSDEKELFRRLINKYGRKKILYAPDVYLEHVMGAERVSKEGVIKVSMLTGEGEYYRLLESKSALQKKLIEYYFKYAVAFIISLGFLILGEKEKAGYLILVRKYILKGFKTISNNS